MTFVRSSERTLHATKSFRNLNTDAIVGRINSALADTNGVDSAGNERNKRTAFRSGQSATGPKAEGDASRMSHCRPFYNRRLIRPRH